MAAHELQTKSNYGEEEGSHQQPSSIEKDTDSPAAAMPSLKAALSSLPKVYTKLVEQGVSDLTELLYVNSTELDEVCNEIKLTGMNKIRFKSTIRNLQAKYVQQEAPIVAISMEEQRAMEQMQLAMKQTDAARSLLEKHLGQIDDQVKTLKNTVDEEIERITNALQSRKKALHSQIDAWKAEKEKSVNSEIADLEKRQSVLQNINNECNSILRGNELVNNREKKIAAKVQSTLGPKESRHSMKDRITKVIVMATIAFDAENISISNIASYGSFKKNETNPLFEVPSITLEEPIKSSDTANGYTVRLKWSTSKEPDDVDNFSVRFRSSNPDDDDEKKAVDEWQIARYGQIETIENTKFAANMDTEMAFDVKYEYEIGMNVMEPFPLRIGSNVRELGIDGKPKGDVVKLPLTVHSHRGHYSRNLPDNLLDDSSSCYWSQEIKHFGSNENDWIIFSVAPNQLYFPTKFCIKNYASSDRTVRTMKIWIGDGLNEWYLFQPSIINIARSNDMQTFDIDGVTSGVIQGKKLSHFKVEFVANHGATSPVWCKYCVKEFQLFGKKF